MAGGKTFKRDQKRRKEMARKLKQEEKKAGGTEGETDEIDDLDAEDGEEEEGEQDEG